MKGASSTAEDAAAPNHSNAYSTKLIEQTLNILSIRTQQNPDYLLSLPQYPRIALQCPSASGGKFWLGVSMETGVSIRWGKIGSNGTVKHFAISKCRNSNPVLELKDRVLGKLKKGYDIIPHETVLP